MCIRDRTDNGDGTATFVMDALNAGDKVSIGGKTYTIGSDEAKVDAWFCLLYTSRCV